MYYSNGNGGNCGCQGSEGKEEFNWEDEINSGIAEGAGFAGGQNFGGNSGSSFGGGQGANFSNGSGSSQGQGRGNAQGNGQGQTVNGRVHNNYYGVNGNTYQVNKKDYYNNHITRYNHIYVKNYKIVKDYVYDYNVVHCSTETVYNGCQYMGSSWCVDKKQDDGCNGGCNGCC